MGCRLFRAGVVWLVVMTSLLVLPAMSTGAIDIVRDRPQAVSISDLVCLRAVGDALPEKHQWLVVPSTPNFATAENGTRAFLSVGKNGVIMVALIGISGDTVNVLASHMIVVGDDPVPPDPGPDPQPDPQPDPLTGLAKQVHDWAVEVVPADGRADGANVLADAYKTIAAQIGAGTLQTPVAIIDASVAANRAALGESRIPAWQPWFEKLREYLNAESEAGKLDTVEAHQAVWLEIAKGLEAVK